MTDLLIPPWLRVSSRRVDAVSNTASAESIFTGSSQTVQRSGARIRYALSIANASNRATDAELAAWSTLRFSACGQANRFWYSPNGYVKRGSFPAAELLTNNDFRAGATGWTASSASDTPIYTVADAVARLKRTGTAAGYKIEQSVTVVNGATYACRALFGTGSESSSTFAARVDTTAGTSITGSGYAIGVKTVSSTTAIASPWAPNSGTNGRHFELHWVSLSRCALISGGSQTGVSLVIDALPVSTNGLLLHGDLVQIGKQLCPVAAPLNSDAAGVGYLQLAYPLRVAPADNDPVIINTPMGYFKLTDNTGGYDELPGGFSNHEFVIEESIR